MLLLADPVDNFWITGADYEGKPFKSVTQVWPISDLIPLADGEEPAATASDAVNSFIAFVKETLGDAVSDVRASDRLTESAVCLVAPEHGMDRQLEKLLAGAGRLDAAAAGARNQSAVMP